MKHHYFLVFQSLCEAFQITEFYGILSVLVIISTLYELNRKINADDFFLNCLGCFTPIVHCTSVCHAMPRNTIPAITNTFKAFDDIGYENLFYSYAEMLVFKSKKYVLLFNLWHHERTIQSVTTQSFNK